MDGNDNIFIRFSDVSKFFERFFQVLVNFDNVAYINEVFKNYSPIYD